MTLNAVQIGEVLEEIRPAVEGCRFVSLFQPSRDVIVLLLEQGGTRHKVLFSMEWWGSRLHLVSRHLPRIKGLQHFFSVLAGDLHGTILREIAQVNTDRIIEARFVSEQAPDAVATRLVVELMGPVSNACLLDSTGRIKAAHRSNFAGRRKLKSGDLYQPPPPPAVSKAQTLGGRFSLEKFDEGKYPLSRVLDAEYETLGKERTAEEQRRRVVDRLRGVRKKLQRKIEAMEKEHREYTAYEREYQLGEILKANLDKIPSRATEVALDDIYLDGQVVIGLDESLSPVENMKRRFKRARKMKAALPIMEERLRRVRRELTSAESALKKAEKGELREGDITEFSGHKRPQPQKQKRKQTKHRLPGIQFSSRDGFSILVGRNNAENDKLTMQVARGNDIWMHIQHQTGSHVIVQLPRGKTLSLDALLDAANLAVYFSKVREARKAPVDYTYKKYVRKQKKAEPGRVTYSNNKTIIIAPDKERLKRLLGKEGV